MSLATALHGPDAAAAVTEYEYKADWQNVVGPHITITFQGYPHGTLINDQYATLGVVFPDGNDFIRYNNSFPNDGVGLGSTSVVTGTIHLQFSQPITAIGSDFPGFITFQLYSRGEMIYQSTPQSSTPASTFGGLVSTTPFDAAVIFDPIGSSVNIDDLYFGPPIPAPGALGLLALMAFAPTRRR